MRTALITGVAGEALTADEAAWLRACRPCGLILFTRNCRDHDQIRALVAAVKTAVGADDLLVLIDQEGGRVQRLRPPLGRALPPAAAYGALYRQDPAAAQRAAFLAARLLARDLRALDINTNCAPVLDVPVDGAHDVIGNRAYGRDPEPIIALGRAVALGFMAGAVLPVVKHVPGHGRATADSHLDLPIVTTARDELRATDFAPFKALSHLPAAMTAHVVFAALDPDRPASASRQVIGSVIRDEIGFDGLLMSDDLSMQALSGPIRSRAEAVIAAGCDVTLHCNGDFAEMVAAGLGTPALAGAALRRYRSALGVLDDAQPFDISAAEEALASVLAGHTRSAESV